MQNYQNLGKPCGYQCGELGSMLPTSLAWWDKTVEQNELNEQLLCSLCLLFAQFIYHESGGIQSDWPCRQLQRSIKPCYCPFQLHTYITYWLKSASLTTLLPFLLNASVDSFPCWWSRSCCSEAILSDSSVLMGCCVRDLANSYMIQSSSSTFLFV